MDKEQNILYRNENISNNKNLKDPNNILNINLKLKYKKLKLFLFDFSLFLFLFFYKATYNDVWNFMFKL